MLFFIKSTILPFYKIIFLIKNFFPLKFMQNLINTHWINFFHIYFDYQNKIVWNCQVHQKICLSMSFKLKSCHRSSTWKELLHASDIVQYIWLICQLIFEVTSKGKRNLLSVLMNLWHTLNDTPTICRDEEKKPLDIIGFFKKCSISL